MVNCVSECKTLCGTTISLICLGWELLIRVVYITVLCVPAILIVCVSFLCQPYTPLSNLKNFSIYSSPLLLCSVMIIEGILCCILCCTCSFVPCRHQTACILCIFHSVYSSYTNTHIPIVLAVVYKQTMGMLLWFIAVPFC